MPSIAAIERAAKRQQEIVAQDELSTKRVDYCGYADRPVEFATEVLGFFITREQRKILESLRDNPITNVQAAHGVGKSLIAAIAVIWWVFAVGGLAITTAPTGNQVKQILWSEIRKIYDRHRDKLGGHRGELFLHLTEQARAYGFTSRDYDSNSFQGKHAEKLLLIEDEACGITEEIDDGFESCLTGSANRGLRIGNPIAPATPFQKACQKSHIRIPVWSHPNVSWAYQIDPEDGIHKLKPDVADAIVDPVTGKVKDQHQWPDWCPRDVISGAVSVNWIEKVRGKSGRFWTSRVEGLFPVDCESSLVPQSWFLAARARYDSNPDYWDNLARQFTCRMGLDVGDGEDPHAMSRWQGPVLYFAAKKECVGDMEDINRAADWAKKELLAYPDSKIWVDRAGVGAGALSILIREKLFAYGTHWGSAARNPKQFKNLKAEQAWKLREAFRLKTNAIAPLGDEVEEELMEDLAGINWEETPNELIIIEKKNKTKERIHRSPNIGDAVIIGFAGYSTQKGLEKSKPSKRNSAKAVDGY